MPDWIWEIKRQLEVKHEAETTSLWNRAERDGVDRYGGHARRERLVGWRRNSVLAISTFRQRWVI